MGTRRALFVALLALNVVVLVLELTTRTPAVMQQLRGAKDSARPVFRVQILPSVLSDDEVEKRRASQVAGSPDVPWEEAAAAPIGQLLETDAAEDSSTAEEAGARALASARIKSEGEAAFAATLAGSLAAAAEARARAATAAVVAAAAAANGVTAAATAEANAAVSAGAGSFSGGPQGNDYGECNSLRKTHGIVTMVTWGTAPKELRDRWDALACNYFFPAAKGAAAPPATDYRHLPPCPAAPTAGNGGGGGAAEEPVVAIVTGTTTRGLAAPGFRTIPLFQNLLPSVVRSADCGFSYLVVVGYDVGDVFFDRAGAIEQVHRWFEENVWQQGLKRGISLKLALLKVNNPVRKPGPVFTAVAKEAYDMGADYIYRVNDDTELATPWARKFSDALLAMGPPYGVVGPESGHLKILVHDFTHRTHMEIFRGQYYPEELTDWWLDDWISAVYGRKRTVRARNVKAVHHTKTHKQRYTVSKDNEKLLPALVKRGQREIESWMRSHPELVSAAALATFLADSFDGKTAQSAENKDIRL